jgi:hypothetical protein
VLFLVRKDVIGNVDKVAYFYLHPVFFPDLPPESIAKPLSVFHTPSGKFPKAAFIPGLRAATRQEEPALIINDDCSDPYADIIHTRFHPVNSRY